MGEVVLAGIPGWYEAIMWVCIACACVGLAWFLGEPR